MEDGDGPATASKFCGTPWIGPDAPWPDCGHCEKPLPLFLQLDLGDLPEELGQPFGTGLLQLFYCTREECQGYGGWEPFADDLSRVRVVRPTGTGLKTSRAATGRLVPREADRRLDPVHRPAEALGARGTRPEVRLRLARLAPSGWSARSWAWCSTTSRIDMLAENIANSELGDKLGGWPAWIQNAEYPDCPRCGQRMVHVFQVDSEDNMPFMFGDAGCGHITQCPDHKEVVAFGWACG